MKKTVFLCVGGDARQTYTAQTLTKIGRVYTNGMDDKGEDTIPLAHLDQLTEKADVLVLPLMKADRKRANTVRPYYGVFKYI